MSLPSSVRYTIKFLMAMILTGVIAGLVGLVLSLILHVVQHIAFGYNLNEVFSTDNFLEAVNASSPLRRVLALVACGVVVGVGWWALYRYGKKTMTIEQAVKNEPHQMPVFTTVVHGLLQMVSVGLGSPLGRELAPREVSASFVGWLSQKMELTEPDIKILVACGAGAGLAAVYNVPLAGALFTLEVLLVSARWQCVAPAIFTSTLAAVIAWAGLGDEQQYHISVMQLSYSLVAWSVLIGPIIGVAAFYFVKITAAAKKAAPKDAKLIPLALINFLLIGVLAIPYPELLGNGKEPLQLGFDGSLTIQLVATLLVIRFFITVTSLRVGAKGGLLTPGLMHGGLIAILFGSLWNYVFPAAPMGAYAIIGATAFLACSMKMPLTAIVLVLELTGVNHDSLVPMLFALVGAIGVFNLLKQVSSNKEITPIKE